MSTCTTLSRELTEPLSGTAAVGATWLLLEQPGPWGARALTESHLDPALGRALEARAKGTGLRIALIRRPGRHADAPPAPSRQVYLAHTRPGRSWIRSLVLDDPAELLALDFAALAAGDHGDSGSAYRGDPLALVCTNGRRDRCCALLGRPLAAELQAGGHAQVWEVTHLGGHRFSPTMLVLPYGYAYGRMSAHAAKDILEATRDGRMVPEWCRGRSFWDRPAQAAELAVREATGEDDAEALTITQHQLAEDLWSVAVSHTNGRRWVVEVRRSEAGPARAESCLAFPTRPDRFEAALVSAAPRSGSGLDRSEPATGAAR
ncbi:sucrase ferredoxin [Streptacidiphilus carbonis]|uniref:sucrase ferredoxin n=1 Tax=Streptacidiphilus carbonis TaxID=105422 RepID=UPI0005A6E76B|nr:sucrase ferredoxin [Streptacidiphilus carbonis]